MLRSSGHAGKSQVRNQIISTKAARGLRAVRAAVEAMESRLMLSNSIVVNSTADTAVGDSTTTGPTVSLREAVNYENANGGGTITFDTSLAGQAITLGTAADETFGPSALAISSDISIEGLTGSSGVTIARNTTAAPTRLRFFYVESGGNLTLQNLTLSGGQALGYDSYEGGASAGLGGAIVNAGTLNIIQSTLENNVAQGGVSGDSTNTPEAEGGAGLNGQPDGFGDGGGANGSEGGSPDTTAAGFAGGGGDGVEGPGGDGGFGGGGGASLSGTAGQGGFGGGGGGSDYTGVPTGGGFGGGGGNRGASNNTDEYGGSGAGMGGAIFNYGGTVSITDSTLADNSAQGGAAASPTEGIVQAAETPDTLNLAAGDGYGGAIFDLNGTVVSDDSTFAFNAASSGGGGAIFSLGASGIATQSGPALGATIATVTLNNSILAKSTFTPGATQLVPDFEDETLSTGTVTTSGTSNVIETTPGYFTPTDGSPATVTADPKFVTTSPAANGGPTPTLALQTTAPASPAIGAGSLAAFNATGLTTDQRGYGFNSPPATVDIGSYQSAALAPDTPSLTVTTTSDTLYGGGTSLRVAVAYAESLGGSQTITFAPDLDGDTVTLATVGDNTAGPSDLMIDSDITIAGPTGDSGITLSNSGDQRLFYIAPAGDLTLENLTLTGGDAVGGSSDYGGGGAGMGGAIFNAGSLDILQSALQSNTAQGGSATGDGAGGGGGLGGDSGGEAGGGPNGGPSPSTNGGFGGGGGFAGNGGFGGGAGGGGGLGGFGGGGGNQNGAGGFGGGEGAENESGEGGGGAGMGGAIFNYGGSVTLTNSTLSNNSALGGTGAGTGSGRGGAIFNLNGSVTSDDSTLAYNTAAYGGGAIYNHGDTPADIGSQSGGPALPSATASVTLNNSILADSASPSDFFTDTGNSGTETTAGTNNLIQTDPAYFTPTADTPATLTGDPDLIGTSPANNGGPTPTFALSSASPTSPAIDAGDNAAIPANTPYDQRGASFDRISNTTVDLGAYEVQIALPTVSATTTSQAATVTTVTINGSNFDTTAANNTVMFNDGAAGTVGSATTTSLTVTFTTQPTGSGSLTAIVTTDSQNSGSPVQVATITPVVTQNTATIPANAAEIVINGFGFHTSESTGVVVGSATPASAPVLSVTFNDGASGTVESSTATSLTVAFSPDPTTAGSLTATVSISGQSSGAAVQVATVIPVVTQNTTTIPANPTSLEIDGFGFDPSASDNSVAFNDGAVGTVTAATATSLYVSFTTEPTGSGSLTAIVTTDSESSGAAVQVGTVAVASPVVTQNTASVPANASGLVISGSNFDSTAANNTVMFNDGAFGTVTAATTTSLSVSFTTDPTTAGSLSAVVTTDSQGSGTPVQVANVIPVVTQNTASIPAQPTTLVINGFGFDPTAANDSVVFNDGAAGTVTAATATSLSVSFTTEPTGQGSLTAVVTTDSESSGAAVQVATVAAPPSGSLSGSHSPAVSTGYNLTTLGTSDWAQFGRGGSATAFNHKNTGNSQISNVTRVGTGGYGGYTSSSYKTSWSDGTPLATDGAEHGYVWANGTIGAGYSFTAPADTTTRTLYVYVGGNSSGSTLVAHLSDAPISSNYTVSFSGSAHYSDIVAITYTSASADQTLTVTYTKSSNINGSSGSADLIGAWLVGPTNQTKPTIVTNPKSQSVTAGTDVMFSAAATGTPPVSVQWERSINGGTSFTTIPGATSTTLDIGVTTTAENGYEYEAIFTNSLGTQATSAATLTVTTPAKTTGSLSGTSSAAGSSYNLTQQGTSDWAHWGRGGNVTNFDHDKSGGSQISNVTRLGSGSFGGYTDGSRRVSWTNGTPTSTDSGDDGYIWANNAIGAGFSFTVPASTTTHTVYVYLGGYSSGGTLTAHLSDSSAKDYVLNLSSSGHYTDVVAITYKAASANQKLTLSYVKSQTIGAASGSVDLIAAWLK